MDTFLARLLLSEKARNVDGDLLRVYLILLADVVTNETITAKTMKSRGMLVSGLAVHMVALYSGLPELTVGRKLDDLSRRGWIKRLTEPKDAYQLGTSANYTSHFFVEEAMKPKTYHKNVAEQAKRYIKECRERVDARNKLTEARRLKIPKPVERKLMEDCGAVPKATTVLLNEYKRLYSEKYGCQLSKVPLFPGRNSYKTTHGALRNYHAWCGADVDEGILFMRWAFANWEKIKEALGSMGGRLDVNALCTKKLHSILWEWRSKGIPKRRITSEGVAGRVDEDKIASAKGIGW